MSIFFILSFDFFGNIILFFDIFDMFYLDRPRIDDEIGDSDDEHTPLDSRTDSIESEILREYNRARKCAIETFFYWDFVGLGIYLRLWSIS